MKTSNLSANLTTKLIKQCKTIRHLHQVHAHSITSGLLLRYSSLILSQILHSFALLLPSAKPPLLLNYVASIFQLIPKPSTFCFNSIIRTHILFSSPLSALHLYSRMRFLSVPPDFHTFPFCLKACSHLRALSVAETLHSQVFKFGFLQDVFVVNSLIRVYSVNGRINDAYRVFDETSRRDVVSYNTIIDGLVKAGKVSRARSVFESMNVRDTVSWGTLIAGYVQAEMFGDAIELFNRMLGFKFRPDNIALVSILSACAQTGDLRQGMAIHDYIKGNRIRVDAFLSTGLVDFYAKCGCIDIAVDLFESATDRNLFTWNAMLSGLAIHGLGQLSLSYFSRMMDARVQPDGVTFLSILVACSHAGLVLEAQNIFSQMESVYGVPRQIKHYGCMADLLGRAGLISEALELIKTMPMRGDVFVWGGLLGGCRTHGDTKIAEKAAMRVMELKPKDGGVYSVMRNVYANLERWEDAAEVRKLMDTKTVKKNGGCSIIQLNGIAHEFIAGDSLHPRTDEIHMILEGIRKHQCEVT